MSEEVEYYPFVWWEFLSRVARIRRRQLGLSLARLKQPVPYARFLYFTAFLWFIVNFIVWFFNWLFKGFIIDNFWWFITYMFVSDTFIVSVLLYAWVQKYWPETVKWQVGNAYPVSVSDYTPGERVDAVEMFLGTDPLAKKERVPVELALGGGVNKLPIPKSKGPVLVARAGVKKVIVTENPATGEQKRTAALQSGFLTGKLYFVPCKPELYILGDMQHWRGVDWTSLINKHFKGQVNDFTRVILALDPMNPETWEMPPDPVHIKRELFEAKQRIMQLQRDYGDYVMEDKSRRSSKRDDYDEY